MSVALQFGVALVVILGAAMLFANAVEIMGGRLKLGQGAVGSVLAAAGTVLPEIMIPVVAILAAVLSGEGEEAAGEIGIGAILIGQCEFSGAKEFLTRWSVRGSSVVWSSRKFGRWKDA